MTWVCSQSTSNREREGRARVVYTKVTREGKTESVFSGGKRVEPEGYDTGRVLLLFFFVSFIYIFLRPNVRFFGRDGTDDARIRRTGDDGKNVYKLYVLSTHVISRSRRETSPTRRYLVLPRRSFSFPSFFFTRKIDRRKIIL